MATADQVQTLFPGGWGCDDDESCNRDCSGGSCVSSGSAAVVVAVLDKCHLGTELRVAPITELDPCCEICWMTDKSRMFQCGHMTCSDCDESWRASGKTTCPFCRATLAPRSTDKDIVIELRCAISSQLVRAHISEVIHRSMRRLSPIECHLLRSRLDQLKNRRCNMSEGDWHRACENLDEFLAIEYLHEVETEEVITENICLETTERVSESNVTPDGPDTATHAKSCDENDGKRGCVGPNVRATSAFTSFRSDIESNSHLDGQQPLSRARKSSCLRRGRSLYDTGLFAESDSHIKATFQEKVGCLRRGRSLPTASSLTEHRSCSRQTGKANFASMRHSLTTAPNAPLLVSETAAEEATLQHDMYDARRWQLSYRSDSVLDPSTGQPILAQLKGSFDDLDVAANDLEADANRRSSFF